MSLYSLSSLDLLAPSVLATHGIGWLGHRGVHLQLQSHGDILYHIGVN